MAKNYHDKMSDAFHGAEKKMAGKSSGGYDCHPETMMPKNARANGGEGGSEFADRGNPVRVAKAEAKNKTSYGSMSKGADIDGDIA